MKLIPFLLFGLLAGLCRAAPGSDEWLKHYYQTQDVTKFDGYWQDVVSNHRLEQRNQLSAVIGFASQVFHQHPALLKGRIDQISDFPDPARPAVEKLLWLANCPQARAVLARSSPNEYADKPSPSIAELNISTGQDLDLCWGWYFATGDTAALDPIISKLNIGNEFGALKRYRTSPQTLADKQAAMDDAICGAAMWSLGANGRADPRVARRVRMVFFDKSRPKTMDPMLSVVVAQLGDVSKQEWESEGGPTINTLGKRP